MFSFAFASYSRAEIMERDEGDFMQEIASTFFGAFGDFTQS